MPRNPSTDAALAHPDSEHAARMTPGSAQLASATNGVKDPVQNGAAGVLDSFLSGVQDATAFLQSSPALADGNRAALQVVYALAAAALESTQFLGRSGVAPTDAAAQPLPALHVSGFDAEQIWLQLDLQSAALLKKVRRLLKKVGDDASILDEEGEEALDELLAAQAGGAVPGASAGDGLTDDNEPVSDSDDDGDSDAEPLDNAGAPRAQHRRAMNVEDLDYDAMLAAGAAADDDDDMSSGSDDNAADGDDGGSELDTDVDDDADDDDDQDADEGPGDKDGDEDGEQELLPTEDDFFRLDDMERFVQQAEEAEARGDRGGLTLLDGDDEDALGSDDDDDEEDEDADDSAGASEEDDSQELDEEERELKRALDGTGGGGVAYTDFFGPQKPYKKAQSRGEGVSGKEADLERLMRRMEAGGDAGDSDEEAPEGGSDEGARSGDDDDDADLAGLSTHEKRQRRIAAQIAELERDAMRDKSWHLRGEASAGGREKDSALALDLDFEQTLRPPPQPTAEMTQSLEDMIKGRILELRFDSVVRVLPPEPARERKGVELDDAKSKAGLAELYERDYLQAATGTVEDKHAKIRLEAQQLFKLLCAKLDALSHMSFTPKPVVTDMEVTVDKPAIAMEEAAPVTMSAANMRAPEEAHAKLKAAPKDEAELTQEERRQRRATKKRIAKRKADEREAAANVAANPKGIKSAREDAEAARAAKKAKRSRTEKYAGATSGGVFKKLQDERAAGGAAAVRRDAALKKAAEAPAVKASQLKM